MKQNRMKRKSCPHTCKILPFYFAVSVICTNFAKLIYNISGLTGFDSGMKWYVSMRSLDG